MSEKSLTKGSGIILLVIWLFIIAGALRQTARAGCEDIDEETCTDVYNTSNSSGYCVYSFDQIFCQNPMQYCDVNTTVCDDNNGFFMIQQSCYCY